MTELAWRNIELTKEEFENLSNEELLSEFEKIILLNYNLIIDSPFEDMMNFPSKKQEIVIRQEFFKRMA